MPTPKAANDLQRDFFLLREELRSDLHRLEARLQRLETRNGLDIETLKQSPLSLGDGNEKLVEDPEEKVADQLGQLELKVRDAVSIGETQPSEDLPDEQAGYVHFGESAWSFPLVIGLAPAGAWDVTFSILLLLLNLGMQAAFSIIILDEDFMGIPFRKQEEFAKRWRTSMAHDYQYMDLAGRSLVSRVCAVDGALILSTTQATLVEQINSFLGLKVDEFEAVFFQPGSLLCMLCILLWSLCVYKEYRSIWLGLEVVWRIPRSKSTVFRDNTFHSICKGRLKLLLFTYLARAAIASLLLGAGIRWLAGTTSITDLMLNAVALNAILDVDEFLFAGFTPISIQLAVQNLEPVKMKYSRLRSQLESFGLLILLIGTLLGPYLLLLQPLAASMIAVKKELCGGNQTFVVGRNSDTQLNAGLVTKSSLDTSELTVSELAVERHKFSAGYEAPYLINFAPNPVIFDQFLSRDMATEVSNWGLCIETEIFQPTGPYYGDPLIMPMVELMLRNAAYSLGHADSDAVGCAGLKHLCSLPDARLLRMVCGNTCGCSDPYASVWHKVPTQGCLPACLQQGTDALAASACEDKVVTEEWDLLWDIYPTSLGAFYGSDMTASSIYPVMLNLVNFMKSAGCSGLTNQNMQRELGTRTLWCEGYPSLWRPLAGLCPVSCGCLGANPLPTYCSSSCAVNTAG
mmetsp:Transcript_38039/g.81816  ORF Transcript_38039/g.81816 Transcript_38039/m.81816 type:complete len:687 (+) Transcript_38039:35-2095(+)